MENYRFPIVTKKIQSVFEQEQKEKPDKTPDICGYYGRACRQMEKEEGANRALCMHCPLAENVKNNFEGSARQ